LVAVGSFFGGAALGSFVAVQLVRKKHRKELGLKTEELERIKEEAALREVNWQREYSALYKNYEKLEKDTLERDYEEFKAPDSNNDDMISRQEFNSYVKKYLSSFPELSEKDFPKFDDFDLDGDGLVSFDEWQKFLSQQKLQESKKKGDKQSDNDIYSQLLNALYEQSAKSDSFNSLQKNLANNKGKIAGRRQ
jgi:Ca2+-binding EF-hand superfamily protein